MTVRQRNNIKNFIPLGVGIANLVLLLSMAYYFGSWVGSMDEFRNQSLINDKSIKQELIIHKSDMDLHMPLKEKIKLFVPRREQEVTNKSIENLLIKLDVKLDRLESKIDNR